MTKTEAINRLVAWAMSQVGYKADNKHNKYAQELDQTNWYNGKKDGYDWCCVFGDYAYYKCFGYTNAKKMLYQPDKSLGAACLYSARYFKEHDAYYSHPEVGDRIFYGEDADDHTGIVVAVNATTIETVEGNVSDSVVHQVVKRTDPWIDGYGRPYWDVVVDEHPLEPADYSAHPQKLWNEFVDWLDNEYGAAGLLGNLDAESALVAANLQNSYQYSLDMSDKEYTDAVDSGKYTDFVDDGAGYGLAQWTHWSRKQKLLDYAKNHNASIGNENMQVGFLEDEIEDQFPVVYRTLRDATSVAQASDAVMLGFERPGDQSEENIQRRRDRCQSFYDKYHSDDPHPTPGGRCEVKALILGIGDRGHAVETLQGALQAHGYDLEYCGGADGIFGEGTEYAVKAYQREHGLTADGVVGEDTWTSLTNN